MLETIAHIFCDVAVDEELQVELREQERNERLQRLDRQILAGVQQVHLGPRSLGQQHVGEISSVLVRLLRSENQQSKSNKTPSKILQKSLKNPSKIC